MGTTFIYGELEFSVNPDTIRILYRNNVRLFSAPTMSTKAQNAGAMGRVVQAKGVLHKQVQDQYNSLQQMALEGSGKMLQFAPYFSFTAILSKLEVQMKGGLQVLEYEMEFVEV